MLHYRPSSEFSPSTAPSQSIALVPYDSEVLSVVEQLPSGEEEQSIIEPHATLFSPTSRLQSLLNFARWANEHERAPVTLDSFLQQVQGERDNVEAVLKNQMSTTAARFVDSLAHPLPDSEDQAYDASNDADDDLGHHTDFEEASTAAEGLEEIEGIGATREIPQATQPPIRANNLIAPHLTPAQLPAARLERKTAKERERTEKREEKIKEIQQRSEIFCCLKSHAQQTLNQTSGRSYQSAETIQLHTGIEVEARWIELRGGMAFENPKRLKKEIQLVLEIMALTAKEGERYWIEVLLHPLSAGIAAPRNEAKIQVSLQTQDQHRQEMRTRPSDYETMGVDTDAIKVGLPTSDNRSPAMPTTQDAYTYKSCRAIKGIDPFTDVVRVNLPGSTLASPTSFTPARSNTPLKITGMEKRFGVVEPTPPVSDAGPIVEAKLEVANTTGAGEKVVEKDVNDKLSRQKELPRSPIKKTVSGLMARKKERSASTGPDHFLSLLDLMRKK
ncbi:hypothetical protein BU25DRAFT_495434 [Macroventuria anomochaeta]|uniref:Uncharacterized protein n=1 Tax=Macroventuria anomochaeta TaxID=301207 RepID=A0ACB6RIM5_9PLEO|nr:uncharacterized protein BU25DRAFT_495434 [Macroventuria anomochaeta]KAF2621861.1 hypothetical protein BU25DRAFT_495434 [Macroventuria anomochaeta]